MVFHYYSRHVLATLILMILTGAARTIGIKVYFQLGFDDPFLTTFFMLFAHSLAIPLYYCLQLFHWRQAFIPVLKTVIVFLLRIIDFALYQVVLVL